MNGVQSEHVKLSLFSFVILFANAIKTDLLHLRAGSASHATNNRMDHNFNMGHFTKYRLTNCKQIEHVWHDL